MHTQKHSEETKAKIREARARQVFSPETREKFRKRMLGNTFNKCRKMHPNTRKALLNAISGENSWKWKGDLVGYAGIHDWIEKIMGKPQECSHCGTKEKRMYHWANISNEYKRDITDWIRLCVPCHKKFDLSKKK